MDLIADLPAPAADSGDGASCCASIVGETVSADDAARLAARFKAIGEPTRLRLLSLVAATEGQEACVVCRAEGMRQGQKTGKTGSDWHRGCEGKASSGALRTWLIPLGA